MTTEAKQRAFDKAYLGLKSQGFERSEDDDICLYRGPDGRRCAAGWLIPDSKYKSGLEGCAVNAMTSEYVASLFGRVSLEFLNDLQNAHDLADGATDMRQRLAKVATAHGLTVPA